MWSHSKDISFPLCPLKCTSCPVLAWLQGKVLPCLMPAPYLVFYIGMIFLYFFGCLSGGGEDLGNDMPFPGICCWGAWWPVPGHHCPVAESK